MRVVITGAGGLIGRAITNRLIAEGAVKSRPIRELVLADLDAIAVPQGASFDIKTVACDVRDQAGVRELFAQGADVVFHFAAIMSAAAERHFERGWAINLDGTRNILDAVSSADNAPTIVFTSTIALYGREVSLPVLDDSAVHPETPYGTQKLIMELMLESYSQRGLIDARIVRVPHVAIREDDTHQGAGGFITAVLKAPLLRRDTVCPVPPEVRVGITTPETVLDSLIHIANLPVNVFEGRRVVQLPSTSLSVADMIAALRDFVPASALDHITFAPDAAFLRLLAGLPSDFQADRARKLGFPTPPPVGEIISQYLQKAGLAAQIQ